MRLLFGLIGLVRLLVAWWYALPVLYRWIRKLLDAAFSEPPETDSPEPEPVDEASDR